MLLKSNAYFVLRAKSVFCEFFWHNAAMNAEAHWVISLPYTVPFKLADWLQTAGSLTNRLIATDLPFSVRLIELSCRPALPDEALVLELTAGRDVLCRQVALRLDGIPVIYAATVCAADCREGRRILDRGGRSLGFTLFAENSPFSRSRVQFSALPPDDIRSVAAWQLLADIAGSHDVPSDCPMWGRRAVFSSRRSGKLLVQELFLPTLLTQLEYACC